MYAISIASYVAFNVFDRLGSPIGVKRKPEPTNGPKKKKAKKDSSSDSRSVYVAHNLTLMYVFIQLF